MGYAFIKLRTTGKNPLKDKIYYIEISEYDDKMKLKKTFSSFLNPEKKLNSIEEKESGLNYKDLIKYPKFEDIHERVLDFLKGNLWGTYHKYSKVLEFLIEEFYDLDIDITYNPKDFIFLDYLEEVLFPKDMNSLWYKYTGLKEKPKEESQIMGEVFKHQVEMTEISTEDFDYMEYVKGSPNPAFDAYLTSNDGELALNFGMYKGKPVSEVPKEYLEWVVSEDFPRTVRIKLKEYV